MKNPSSTMVTSENGSSARLPTVGGAHRHPKLPAVVRLLAFSTGSRSVAMVLGLTGDAAVGKAQAAKPMDYVIRQLLLSRRSTELSRK